MLKKRNFLFVVMVLFLMILPLFVYATEIKDEQLKSDLPYLYEVTSEEPMIQDLLKEYSSFVFNPETVTSEATLKTVFQMREKLIENCLDLIFDWFYAAEEGGYSSELEEEFNLIGLRIVYAEGAVTHLTTFPILENQIGKIVSRPYQMYLDFNNALADSYGGEYSYMDLGSQMKMIELGEKMRRDFPDNEYTKSIEKDFFEALATLTDVHAVIGQDDEGARLILFGTDVSAWPSLTRIDNFHAFIEKHETSQFVGIIKNILENMSEIELNAESKYDLLYLVAVDVVDTDSLGSKMIQEYLLSGEDIPHLIPIIENGKEKYAVVYRFYSSEQKAKQALAKIQERHERAKIITINNANAAVFAR